MTRVILHIGPHKTGSTALQRAFVANRVALSAKGVVYPTEWQGFLYGHHELAWSVEEWAARPASADVAEARGTLGELASTAPCLLLSSEDFVLLDERALDVLATLLDGLDVNVVFIIRNWADLIPSHWQETVKHGSTQTFPSFVSTLLAKPGASDVLEYRRPLDRFADALGGGNLRIVSYDAVAASETTLVDYFVRDVLAVHVDMRPIRGRPNASDPAVVTEIIRALNAMAADEGRSRPRNAFEELRRGGHETVETTMRALQPFLRSMEIPRDLPDYVMATRRVMERYGDVVLNAPHGDLVILGAPRAAAYVDSAYRDDPRLLELLERLYRALPADAA